MDLILLYRFQNLASRLSVLILMRVWSLHIHPILGLKLLKKLAIILLHIHIVRPLQVTIHAISSAIVSLLVQHLLRATRVEVLHPDIFLLLLADHLVSSVHDIDSLVAFS